MHATDLEPDHAFRERKRVSVRERGHRDVAGHEGSGEMVHAAPPAEHLAVGGRQGTAVVDREAHRADGPHRDGLRLGRGSAGVDAPISG
ncbi:MAG: hypothetical protein H6745_03080 [Deltaproteobacteria bacterium]|nr:hypothetical protein [Deltaproteobacteria bacterium]